MGSRRGGEKKEENEEKEGWGKNARALLYIKLMNLLAERGKSFKRRGRWADSLHSSPRFLAFAAARGGNRGGGGKGETAHGLYAPLLSISSIHSTPEEAMKKEREENFERGERKGRNAAKNAASSSFFIYNTFSASSGVERETWGGEGKNHTVHTFLSFYLSYAAGQKGREINKKKERGEV